EEPKCACFSSCVLLSPPDPGSVFFTDFAYSTLFTCGVRDCYFSNAGVLYTTPPQNATLFFTKAGKREKRRPASSRAPLPFENLSERSLFLLLGRPCLLRPRPAADLTAAVCGHVRGHPPTPQPPLGKVIDGGIAAGKAGHAEEH